MHCFFELCDMNIARHYHHLFKVPKHGFPDGVHECHHMLYADVNRTWKLHL